MLALVIIHIASGTSYVTFCVFTFLYLLLFVLFDLDIIFTKDKVLFYILLIIKLPNIEKL